MVAKTIKMKAAGMEKARQELESTARDGALKMIVLMTDGEDTGSTHRRADIVELNPDRDLNGVTAMVAAKLLKEILAGMLSSQA